MRVQLEPIACFLDDQGHPLPQNNHDWIVQSFSDRDSVTIQNESNPIIAELGKDHIYDFRSNPARSTGQLKYGFLVLKMQVFVQGNRLWLRPNRAPGEAVHVDVMEMQRELDRLRAAVAPRRLTEWQKQRIASALKGKSFQVWVGTVHTDGEARGLWQDIVSALQSAGLEVIPHTSWELAQGVSITPAGGMAREDLKAAFRAASIELWDSNGEGARLSRLEIIVGSKIPAI